MRKAITALALIGGTLAAMPACAEDGRAGMLAMHAVAVQQAGFAATDSQPALPAAPRLAGAGFRLTATAALVPPATGPVAGAPIKVGPAPAPLGPGLLDHAPRLGAFDLTFASDMPASGIDPMFNAEVVVALTRRF